MATWTMDNGGYSLDPFSLQFFTVYNIAILLNSVKNGVGSLHEKYCR